MYVLTADQTASRGDPDAVPGVLGALNGVYADVLELPFERTAGDEVQGLCARAETAVDIVCDLLRWSNWSIGVGVGVVDAPMPETTRAGRGEAYVLARAAVERAKSSPHPVCIDSARQQAGERAESAAWLLAGLLARRSKAGWEAVDAMTTHDRQVAAAEYLGISAQAVSSRLRVAGWAEERRGRMLAAYLLQEAS